MTFKYIQLEPINNNNHIKQYLTNTRSLALRLLYSLENATAKTIKIMRPKDIAWKPATDAIRKHAREHALAWEITLVLVIKLFAIIAIKNMFFSDPIDMSHPSNRIENQMLTIKEKSDG